MLRFRSKIDAWLLATMAIGALVPAISVSLALGAGAPLVLILIPVLTLGLTTWTIAGTWYGLDDASLHVRCGPFRRAIPLAEIRELRRTRSTGSAAALSLDRLEVRGDTALAVISPRDRAGFIRAIEQRVPGVRIDDRGAPPDLRIGWLLLALPVLVTVVVGVVLFKQRSPLDLTLTAGTLSISGSHSVSLNLTDIEAISLVETLPALHKVRGFNSMTTLRGRFRDPTLGTGDVFVRRDLPPYIVARTPSGFLIVNMDDPADTHRVYADLQQRLAAR